MRRGKRPAAGGTGPGLPGPWRGLVFPTQAPAAPSRPLRAVARAPKCPRAPKRTTGLPGTRGTGTRWPVTISSGPPGLPGPVAWAVGTSHHPASEKASVAPNPPGLGRPSGCGSRGRRGQAGGVARCWCGAPVWRRCARRWGIGCTKRVHKRVFPTEGGRSRLCVWFPDPAMTSPARLPQEDPLRGRRPLSRPYVGWMSGGGRAEEENE